MTPRLISGQFAAPAQRVSGDGGNDRLADGSCPVLSIGKEVGLEHVHIGAGLHLPDVRARGKSAFRAGEDDAANAIIRVPFFDNVDKLCKQFRVEGVQRLGTVEGDDASGIFDLHQNVFVLHCDTISGPHAFLRPWG